VRDGRLAVGVMAAEDGVITLRVSCQKFLSTLDPLTLRLFSRLRQQQEDALQVCRVCRAGNYMWSDCHMLGTVIDRSEHLCREHKLSSYGIIHYTAVDGSQYIRKVVSKARDRPCVTGIPCLLGRQWYLTCEHFAGPEHQQCQSQPQPLHAGCVVS
jgi:hypothetical protein